MRKVKFAYFLIAALAAVIVQSTMYLHWRTGASLTSAVFFNTAVLLTVVCGPLFFAVRFYHQRVKSNKGENT